MAELTPQSKEYIKFFESNSKTSLEEIYRLINDLKVKINAQRLTKTPLKASKARFKGH